jgi:hypothetical protein
MTRTKGAGDAMGRAQEAFERLARSTSLCWHNPDDPRYVRDRIVEIEEDVAMIRRIMRDEIDPLLARANPKMQEQIDDLATRLARIERGATIRLEQD